MLHVTGHVLGSTKKPFEKILYLILYEVALETSSSIYLQMQRSREILCSLAFIKEHYFHVRNQRVA